MVFRLCHATKLMACRASGLPRAACRRPQQAGPLRCLDLKPGPRAPVQARDWTPVFKSAPRLGPRRRPTQPHARPNGTVSAAVEGMRVGEAVVESLTGVCLGLGF